MVQEWLPEFSPGEYDMTKMTGIERAQFLNKLCRGQYAAVVNKVITRSADLAIQQRGFMAFLKVDNPFDSPVDAEASARVRTSLA